MFKNKKILLGITGSISAYKSAYLIRLLVKEGADVRVLLTKSAASFVSPLTFSVLSKNKVYTDFQNEDFSWNNHIDLALWADVFVIAPASLNTISKMANGICDNLLLACYFSSRCPVFVAPAMDVDMFLHAASQRNLNRLKEDRCKLINPGTGELASGLTGEGRLAEPEEITSVLRDFFSEPSPLAGKKILITAGPTYEMIDPVRFVGNFSSGKMGFALAECLADKGAKVSLVAGPVHIETQNKNIHRIDVNSADEMHQKCMELFPDADIILMSAAVSDFKPRLVNTEKIKKEGKAEMQLELHANVDILSEMGKRKKGNQILIGFALETNNELENAKLKVQNKNLDFIVLNSLNDKGAGFKTDTNKISIIDKNGEVSNFDLKSKKEVAKDIVNKIENEFPD